jgi:cytochrome c556
LLFSRIFRKMNWRIAVALGCFIGATIWQSAASAHDPVESQNVVPISKDEADMLIFERQQVMMQLADDAEVLGAIVAYEAPKTKLAETTRALAKGAKEARESFKNGVTGGRSKDNVWANRADFAKRMDDFVRESDAMAKLGEAGNLNGVTEKMIAALPCKECHDVYREPKKGAGK